MNWDEVKKDIIAEISPWMNEEAANKRAELLMRHHAFSAYAAAQAREMDAMADIFPYRQYISTEDAKVRPTHAALNGLILPANHPFWQNHTPPWEWNCRCDVVQLTELDFEEEQFRDKKRPIDQRRVLEGAALDKLEKEDKLVRGPGLIVDTRTPKQRGGKFEINVRNLNLPYDEIKKRWDLKTAQDFEAWAGKQQISDKGKSVLDWLKGKITKVVPRKKLVHQHTLNQVTENVLALEKDYAATLENIQKLMNGGDESDEVVAKIAKEWTKSQALVEQAREAVSIPENSRGTAKFIGKYTGDDGKRKKTTPAILKNTESGGEIVARYTHPDYMPSVVVRGHRKNRAFFSTLENTMYVSKKDSSSTIAHETMHAIETQFALHKSTRKFLLKRAKGEEVQLLSDLTGLAYPPTEKAYEDKWKLKGGDHYMGKDYGDIGSEILSMGIERLHQNPIEFAKNDREYFEFLIKLIQKR